MSLYFEEHF